MREVIKIPPDLAQEVSVKNHYLHRKCPCSIAYGLFYEDVLKGVIIYGCPSSSTLKRGICGDDEANHVIELKRLWVDDSVTDFPESYLISQSLKQLKHDLSDKDIIVSYADGGFGHTGIVYQATNWIYTGQSAKFKDVVLKDDPRDHLTQADELKRKYGSMKEARRILGEDKFTTIERSRKYRYIYFNGSKTRRRELKKKLKYPILKYPKVTE